MTDYETLFNECRSRRLRDQGRIAELERHWHREEKNANRLSVALAEAEAALAERDRMLRLLLSDEYDEHFYGHPGDSGYVTKEEWVENWLADLKARAEERSE